MAALAPVTYLPSPDEVHRINSTGGKVEDVLIFSGTSEGVGKLFLAELGLSNDDHYSGLGGLLNEEVE